MVRISRIALGVAALVVVTLPAGATCIPTTVLTEGQISPYDPSPLCESGTCPGEDVAIRNSSDFAKWWVKVSNDPPPAINFDTQLVIATFMGKRPNTSYTTNVTCVEPPAFATLPPIPLTVHITDSNAGVGCITQPAIVSPYEFVVFDKPTNGLGQPQRVTVSFDHETQVYPCDGNGNICQVCGGGNGNGNVGQNGIPCCP